MSSEFLELKGIIVPASSIALVRAKAVADVLSGGRIPFLKLVECRQFTTSGGDNAEAIVVDIDVERPQHCVNDIHKEERVAIIFGPSDELAPEVLALRGDFPRVPHTNIRPTEYPRSLCLYDEPWSQIVIRWTPVNFLERIRFWLAETAKGTLHQADQPLEPLLMGGGYQLILPPDLFDTAKSDEHEELRIRLATRDADCRILVANRDKDAPGLKFLAMCFIANPQAHGAIRHSPSNLQELHDFVSPVGVPLLDSLREKLQDWSGAGYRDKQLLLVIAFPLTRDGGSAIEASSTWVFLTTRSIEEIGVDIGIWQKTSGELGKIFLDRDPARNGQEIPLEIVSPVFDMTRKSAAAASGLEFDLRRVFAVGAGALGSQIIKLLVRTGFGVWHILDSDILLPHNISRHELDRWAIGMSKAEALSIDLHQTLDEPETAGWTCADILRPGKLADEIQQQIEKADLILDLAAEIPVSRYLTHENKTSARRIAVFLNPRGTDLVLLSEDTQRSISLDCLELQYYRAVANEESLTEHLKEPEGRIRYARSCRDVSSTIPADLVAMHSAIGARAVRAAAGEEQAAIRIWRADGKTSETRLVEVPAVSCCRQQIGSWTLTLDEYLLKKLTQLRQGKLPVETGGVLIGSFDLARKILYVVDTIPSPPDSKEWPTLYIRGSQGLFKHVQDIGQKTNDQLEYVGEWHSHPDGCSCLPSDDDLKVFSWLTSNMDDAGLPALMAIADQNGIAWYLGQMLRTGGWETPA
jgi:proteasome lid subunit RPN8/RPN11